MVTAIMIAMFYLGTASGVMAAVLMGTSRSSDSVRAEPLLDAVAARDELGRAA